jgi:hypothetical protein
VVSTYFFFWADNARMINDLWTDQIDGDAGIFVCHAAWSTVGIGRFRERRFRPAITRNLSR